MMAESVNDVATVQRNLQRAMEGAEDDLIAQGRQARELQRDLLRTRHVTGHRVGVAVCGFVVQFNMLGKRLITSTNPRTAKASCGYRLSQPSFCINGPAMPTKRQWG